MAKSIIFICTALLSISCPSLASTTGSLAFFLDGDCSQAATVNPTANLPIDTCLVTHGAEGISVQALPPCSSGDATLVVYKDTLCANALNEDNQSHLNANCHYWGIDDVPAVMFVCNSVAGEAAATSTSTVSAGSTAIPIAGQTPATVSPGGNPAQTTPSSNGASSTPSTNSAGTDSNGGDSSPGLSHNAQIAIGVGVPIASLCVALLAWLYPRHKKRTNAEANSPHELKSYPPSVHPSMHTPFSPAVSSVGPLSERGYGGQFPSPGVQGPYGHGGRPW